MIYEFDGTLRETTVGHIREDRLTAGYLSLEALKASYRTLDFPEDALRACTLESVNFRSSLEVGEAYAFGMLNVIDVNDVYGPRDRIAFLIRRNLFLVVDIHDADNSTKERFDFAIRRFQPESMTLERLVYGFFDRLLYEDGKGLERKELAIETMEEDIHAGAIDRRFIGSILALKKEASILRNYYEQMIEIGEELEDNESGLFPSGDLRYFKLFIRRAQRLSGNCQMLKENLVQVREAYSSSLDYSINAVMKIFTVVTTIFQPLTLITGWYGMNFTNMPELTWRYGYVSVMGVSIAVVLFCLWLFRRKRLL